MKYRFNYTELVCHVAENADITGVLSRLSTQVVLGITIATVYALFATLRAYPNIAQVLRNIVLALNGVSVLYAIMLASVGLATRHQMNWFHARFLLDAPSFAANSVLFTALAVPGYFTRHWFIIPSIIVLFILMIASFMEWEKLYGAALIALPGCYDEMFLKDVHEYASIEFGVYVGICFVLAIFNPEIPHHVDIGHDNDDNDDNILWRWIKTTCRRWSTRIWNSLAVVALLALTIVTGYEMHYSSSDYRLLQRLLTDAAPVATFGQIIPLATVCIAVALTYAIHFDVNGRSRRQFSALSTRLAALVRRMRGQKIGSVADIELGLRDRHTVYDTR
ncbi:hypothetical protein LTR97_000276 [Elasticomyces elasticus]|uniref:Uncharacterized protein n=1 Tax=Elasticomyces elasticus TaxID=574655 RepID=A0AAN7WCM1_9PEZI|nr:hypothetical protein LTR97_000276 [Elasticomyces elasticus]